MFQLAEIFNLAQGSGWNLQILLVLLIVASSVAAVVKWIRLPYSIALVIAGLLVGVFHLLPRVEMTPEFILVLMLPALLFEAAWNLRFKELKANWLPISVFATLGVVISMLVVAALMYFFSELGLAAALLFGALISATDPISVLALFRKLGVNKRLSLIMEGESLFNDGTAVVLFKLVLLSAIAGTTISLTSAAGSFALMVGGGAVLGVGLGFAASRLTSYFDDHLLEVTLTAILAYGSYLVAEALHVSPVIATICAGLVMGNYGSRVGMSDHTRHAVSLFWEYAAFVVNSLVFLLIGLQIKMDLLIDHSGLIAIGIIAILVARALLVYGLSPVIARLEKKDLPKPWRHVLVWGGLRGSLCMALALSLPADFPQREALVVVTFGVVLFTLIVKGLTIELLVKRLKLVEKRKEKNETPPPPNKTEE